MNESYCQFIDESPSFQSAAPEDEEEAPMEAEEEAAMEAEEEAVTVEESEPPTSNTPEVRKFTALGPVFTK